MKGFLKHLAFTALSGLVFFVAVSAALLLSEYWEHRSVRYPFAPPVVLVHDPAKLAQLVIENHSQVEAADKFTVRGEIRNTANFQWHDVQLRLKLFAGDAQLTTCSSWGHLRQVNPGEIIAFQVSCLETQGKGLPEYIRYEVFVDDASRHDA